MTTTSPGTQSRTILAVESSCDETGAAVMRVTWDEALPAEEEGSAVRPRVETLSDVVASSMEQHARFGGVVPEIASRAHLEALQPVVREALRRAGEALGPAAPASPPDTSPAQGSRTLGPRPPSSSSGST